MSMAREGEDGRRLDEPGRAEGAARILRGLVRHRIGTHTDKALRMHYGKEIGDGLI